MFTIYKIYYNDNSLIPVYIGRTTQLLHKRIYSHITKKVNSKKSSKIAKLDINKIHHIEYCECDSEADMMIYELYYINKFRPVLNIDAKSKIDDLTIELPEMAWKLFFNYLLEEWKHTLKLNSLDIGAKDKTNDVIINNFKEAYSNNKKTMSNEDFLAWVELCKTTNEYSYNLWSSQFRN